MIRHDTRRQILLSVGAMLLLFSVACSGFAGEKQQPGRLALDQIPAATFHFNGFVGRRIRADVENWLIVVPKTDPGLLEMFARRDSGTKPDLVPWAGEFVGKYLISGVEAMRMSDDPRLRQTLQGVVDRLIELQAEDGYLGPWPKSERLLGHWDLWGHYHVMLGLMLWHEQTGDQRAMEACRRIGDLVCRTYLDTDRRVFDAGSQEMNMGIIHGMARLYRKTGQARYLRMAQEVLKDFERAGDYFRTGLEGTEFFRTPRPRWESLHSLQGMAELAQITGDPRYRRAFLSHWASIRRFDLRNTGGFSSGERATGDPYRNDAIETCCVIAWQAVMIDALRLTGDARIADDLERATFNAVFGSQHPSGKWCTYSTPMDGRRVASHVAIKFQARPDTPHLNCCSVNGPRGYGMLSEWGVMRARDGLAVNYYGPMEARVSLADGTPVGIHQETDYPIGPRVTLRLDLPRPKPFTLRLRIPAWSSVTQATVAGEAVSDVRPGRYLKLTRRWQAGDEIELKFDMSLRYQAGDFEQYGRASLYRGPILLALDDRFKTGDVAGKTVAVDVSRLDEAKVVAVDPQIARAAGEYPPWLVVDLPGAGGKTLRLVDFASAGATGGEYVSWLPAAGLRPPRPVAWEPADGSRIGPGAIRFSWRRPAAAATKSRQHTVVLSDSPDFETIAARFGPQCGRRLLVGPEEVAKLKPKRPYYWKIIAQNAFGRTESLGPPKRFTIDPAAPPMPRRESGQRESDRMVTAAPLAGDVRPEYGTLASAAGWKPAPGPGGQPRTAIELDGQGGLVTYKLVGFPEEEYTVSIWAFPTRLPDAGLGQVFSAWCAGMDDPLRLVVQRGKLFARIETAAVYGTQGFPLEPGRWYHIVGVKGTDKLTLYVDGQARSSTPAPLLIWSGAKSFAVGGNPKYRGAPEFFAGRVADLRFYARAFSAEEVKRLHQAGCGNGG